MQSVASLPTDEEAPDDHGDYHSSSWVSLTEEALDGVVTSCVLQANLHWFVHTGSQTPLDSSNVADNILSFHHGSHMVVLTHKIMMCYAPCSPGFLATLLGKPLMSQLNLPASLTTLFSASILNHQILP